MANRANLSLQQWVDDPQSRKIVIILTCAISLLALWFAADEYFAVRGDMAQLTRLIAEAQQQSARLDELEQRAVQQSEQTKTLERRTVPEGRVHEFRNTLSDLTRRSGCRIVRMELAEPRRRPWREDDHPLEVKPASRKAVETPYQLRSQQISLTLTGPINSVYDMLGELRAMDKAIHTQSLRLRPADAQRQEAILELEMILFDLESKKRPKSA